MNKKKWLWLIITIIIIFLLLALFSGKEKLPAKKLDIKKPVQNELDEWAKFRANDIPEIADGWSAPVFLEVSNLGWFESLHVSGDGKIIYMFYYPATMDFVTLREKGGPFTDDGDTVYSEFPFKTFKILDKYYLSEDLYTTSGASTDADGNFFYSSNREGRPKGMFPEEYDNQNIFRNNELLSFNSKDENADNPFYCKAKDELWYDCAMDQLICILKDAAKNNFSGKSVLAPKPINFRSEQANYFGAGLTEFINTQAWLTPDCNTIYWTSNRGRPNGSSWIYSSKRLDEKGNKWSEPEVVIKGKVAVAEPTLTTDGSKLFFIQFIMNDKIDPAVGHGEVRSVLYYIERK